MTTSMKPSLMLFRVVDEIVTNAVDCGVLQWLWLLMEIRVLMLLMMVIMDCLRKSVVNGKAIEKGIRSSVFELPLFDSAAAAASAFVSNRMEWLLLHMVLFIMP